MKKNKYLAASPLPFKSILLVLAFGLLTLPAFSQGTIGNQIWFDSDADGAQSSAEASGAPGVVVALLNSAGAVVSTQTTGPNGNFLFTGVPAGTYELQVTTPAGFQVGPIGTDSLAGPNGVVSNIVVAGAPVTANVGLLANPACFLLDDFTTASSTSLFNPTPGTQAFTTVTGPGIIGGERDVEFNILQNLPSGIDLAAFSVAGGGDYTMGSIAGAYVLKTTLTWDGMDGDATMLDATGLGGLDFTAAANGVLTNDVFNFDLVALDQPAIFTVEVFTDAGNYSTFNTTLSTVAPPTLPQTIPFSAFTTTAGAGADFSNVGAVRFMVEAITQDLDVTIRTIGKSPTLAAIGNRVWEDLDADGAQGAGEPGIPGVTVNLYSQLSPGTILSTTTTGPTGEYLFSGLQPGDYFVEFVPPAGSVLTTRDAAGVSDGVDSDANPANGRTIPTTLDPGEADLTWDAGIYTPAEVGDFVWFDTDRDGIQDPGEMGIPGVTVELFDDNGVSQGTMVTGPTGGYMFTGLLPGDYMLQFTVPPGYIVSPQDVGGDATDSDINSTGSTVNFTLNSGDSDPDWDAGLYRLVPGYELIKTTTGPLDAGGNVRTAEIGEQVTFTITINNTGEVQLVTVPLTDTYNPTELNFVSASPAQSSATAGGLNWANLGSIAPGASRTVDLTFTALTSTFGVMKDNSATTSPTTPANQDPVAPQTDTAPYTIAAPSYTITKDRRGPVDREVGQPITFDIVITNTGEVDLNTVPVVDFFDNSSVSFVSAVPPVSSTSASTLTWLDVGSIPVGGMTSIAVTFNTIASTGGALDLNTAQTAPITVNGNVLPQMEADDDYRVLAPAYTIVKNRIAPATLPAAVGEMVSFNIVVANTGEVPLTTVPLTDTFDASVLSFVSSSAGAPDSAAPAGTLTWNDIGSIAPNSSIAVTVNFTATASSNGAVLQNNAATTPSTANGPLGPMDSDAPYSVAAPGFTITKTRVSPLVAEVGDDVIFDVVITNTGEIPFTTVPLTDTYDPAFISFQSATPSNPNLQTPGNLAWNNLGPLAPAASFTVRMTFEALQSTSGANEINTAATGPSTSTQTLPEEDADAPYQVAAPSYTITKTRTTALDAEVGETVTFTIVVANTGELPLATVPLDDVYDANFLSFASASIPPTTAAPGSLAWNDIGAIGVGSQRAVTVNFTALASTAGALEDNVAGTMPSTANQTLPRDTDDDVYRVLEPSFIIRKDIITPNLPAAVGDTIVFRIEVENDGEVPLVTVPVVDTYDAADLQFVSATSGGISPAAGTVQWADIGPIAIGAIASVDVTFTALASEPGDLNIAATVPTTPAGPLPEQEADEPYEIVSPSYTITKTRTSPQVAEIGGPVTFEVVILNDGDVTLTSVPLTDTYDPAFLLFQSSTPSAPNLQTPGNLVWNNLGLLPANSSHTVRLTFEALQSTGGLNETNTASTAPSTSNMTLPQMEDEAPYEIATPAYTITKVRTTPVNAEVGDTVTFQITVSNTGEVPLATVPLDDVYDSSFLAFDSASVVPTTVSPGNLNWANIGAIGTGNQRTVTVNFTALASTGGALEDNVAGTMPSTATQTLPRDEDDAQYRVRAPSYTITKDLVSPTLPAAVGEDLVFRITVTNDGEVNLVTVPLVDTYDAADLQFVSATAGGTSPSAGTVQWANIGPITPGNSASAEVTFTALAAEPGDLNEVATTPSTPSGPLPEQEADEPYEIVSPSYTITKTRTTAQQVEVGETVSFDIVITNDGNVPLTSVPLADTWDATYLSFVSASPAEDTNTANSLTWNDLGQLAAGASHTVTVNYEALVSTVVPRTNTASTIPTTSVGPLPEMSDSDVFESVTPGFEIVKTRVSPTALPGSPGDNFVFQITVENTGEVDFVTVPLVDTHDPALLTFASATPGPSSSSASGGTVNWVNLGPLPVGAIHTVDVTFVAAGSTGGTLEDNTASSAPVTAAGPLPEQSATAPFATVEPAYTITKTRTTPSPVNVGDPVSFDIVVSNTGDQALTVVPLNDTYDATFLTFVSASPAEDTAAAGSIDWNDLGSLPVGSAHTVTVNFTAAASTLGNAEINTATTTPDGLPPVSAEDDYEIGSPDYSISKTRITAQQAAIGETVTFEITVANTGDVTLQTVPLDDTYDPAILQFVNAVPSLPNSASPGNLVWNNIGSIAPGADRTITVNFTALQFSPSTTNSVTTEPVTVDGTTLPQDGDRAEVVIGVLPQIQLEKMVLAGANGNCANAVEGVNELQEGVTGTPVTYCFRVTNIGDVHLANIGLSDPQLNLTSTAAFTPVGTVAITPLAPGASALFSASSTIDGDRVNEATVVGTPSDPAGTPLVGQPNVSDMNTAQVTLRINIGNYVWLDSDRDGMQDLNEDGVENVTVELLDGGENVIQTTITDANGFYQFVNLPQGFYTTRFNLPLGFEPTIADAGANDGMDSDGVTVATVGGVAITQAGVPVNYTVDIDNLDQGIVPAFASIGDTVWQDLANDQDATNDNLAELGLTNVTVFLYSVDGATTSLVDTAVTGPSGQYLFDMLDPGTYFVELDQSTIPIPNGFTFDITTPASYLTTVGPGDEVLTDDFGILLIGPTAVELESLGATSTDAGTEITWTTGAETDSLGFYVIGSDTADGPGTQLNDAIILSQGGNGSYSLTDTTGYNFYRLVEVDNALNHNDYGSIAIRSLVLVDAGAGTDVVQGGEVLPAAETAAGLVVYASAADLELVASDAPARMASGSGVDATSDSPFVTAIGAVVVDVANPASPVLLAGEPLEAGDGATYYAPAPGAVIEVLE